MRTHLNALARGILPALLVLLFPHVAAGKFEAGTLGGVARVEIALDPFSQGPWLVKDLSRRPALTPFQAELLRRLRRGSGGSAFAVSPDLLVTTAHVVLAGARYSGLNLSPNQWASLEAQVLTCVRPWISLASPSHRRPAEVIALDIEKDLALLRLFPGEAAPVPLPVADSSRLQIGTPVVVMGYSGNGLRVARGEVRSLIRGQKVTESARLQMQAGGRTPIIVGAAEGEIVRVQHSASTEGGMSGGPLVDEEGRVVGVAYGLLRPAENARASSPGLNLAIAGGVLEKFLSEHKSAPAAPAAENLAGLPQGSPQPAADRERPWLASAAELQEIETWISRGNSARAIPVLEGWLRRDRHNFRARALLARAHYEESRLRPEGGAHVLASLYQSAWLAFFAPEISFAENAAAALEDAGLRRKASPFASGPAPRTLLLSLEISSRLQALLTSGALPDNLDTEAREMRRLLQECEQARARADTLDPVAAAALARAYLSLEQTAELQSRLGREGLLQERRVFLHNALSLVYPLSGQLERSPGAHALLGLVYARLGRIDGNPDLLERARQAYEKASVLDPESPSVRAALVPLAAQIAGG